MKIPHFRSFLRPTSYQTLSAWVATTTILSLAAASASTIAYYRFEDITDATSVVVSPPVNGTGLQGDQSNGGTTFSPSYSDAGAPSISDNNKLRTWTDGSSPVSSTNVPVATVPLNGLVNNRSMDFTGGKDIFTNDAGTQGSLGAGTYNSLTFESYVRIANPTTGWVRSLFVVDDWNNVNSSPEPTLEFRFDIFNSNTVRLTALANSATVGSSNYTGNPLFLSTPTLSLPDNGWFHVALTIDAATSAMKIFLNGVEQASTNQLSGGYRGNPIHNQFVLGRGFYNGAGDSLNGGLDEVRFSDVALTPSQFLNAVPEPSSVAILFGSVGTLLLLRRRK